MHFTALLSLRNRNVDESTMYSTDCSEPNTIAMAVMTSGDNACSLHAYDATKLKGRRSWGTHVVSGQHTP